MIKIIIKIMIFLFWLSLAYYLSWKFYLRLRTLSIIIYILLYYFLIRNNPSYKKIIERWKSKINSLFNKKL